MSNPANFGGHTRRDAHTGRMEETSAPTGPSLKPKTIWIWLAIATAIPFLMLAAIIVLMVTLNFNILDWME
jgi:hypothetical protein